MTRPRRNPEQAIRWWWQTRVRPWWSVRLPALWRARRGTTRVHSALQWAAPGGDLPVRASGDITAILTRYKRGQYLSDQVAALRAQTRPPAEIWLWCNDAGEAAEDVSALVDRVVISDSNWKFWGRFALANLARTPYVALFDDDILPEPRWFENCLATYAAGVDGILGGSGVILPTTGGYSSKHKVGWNGHHLDRPAAVDLVGHAWFLKKSMLRYMWAEEPYSWENGEDIHLGYMALKHGGLGTYVPAHPEAEPALWSCRPDFGKAVGRSSTATFKGESHHSTRDEIVDHYRSDGWRLVSDADSPVPRVLPPADFSALGRVQPAVPARSFAGDLDRFTRWIREGENFALVRFGDGEMKIIDGEAIDLSHKHGGEHRYIPGGEADERQRALLYQSLVWQAPHYHVGIACPCCVGDDNFFQLKQRSGQDEAHLTWANLFVNSNYPRFMSETVAAIASRKVSMVCRTAADTSGLPFALERVFRVGANAWISDHDRVLQELRAYCRSSTESSQLFLFSAGVLSNILVYELAREFPEHSFIDVGSVFDVKLGLGQTRKYLKKGRTLGKTCVWK